MYIYVHIETDSRKWALNDVTKCFLFHKKSNFNQEKCTQSYEPVAIFMKSSMYSKGHSYIVIPAVHALHKEVMSKLCPSSWHIVIESLVWMACKCYYYCSTSELQPSAATANQLPDHLFSTKIRAMSIGNVQHKECIESWVTVWLCIFYNIGLVLLEQSLPKYQPLITSGAYTHNTHIYTYIFS